MKLNKLAAGALALALGLGAVAPAVASEGRTGKSYVQEDYNEKIQEVEKLYVKKEADKAALATAKANAKAAEEAAKKAEKAYNDAKKVEADKKVPTTVKEAQEAAQKAETAYNTALEAYNAIANDKDAKVDAINAARDAYKKAELAKAKAQAELKEAVAKANEPKADAELTPKAKAFNDYAAALAKLDEANAAVQKADEAYNGKIDDKGKYTKDVDGSREKYEVELGKLADYAKGIGAILNVEGGKITVTPAKEEVKKDRAELVKALEAAKTRAEVAISSAEFLLKQAPKSVAKVKDVLEKQIKDAKATIEKANKALGVKSAFIATAYADEASDADLEALTKELNKNAEDIENTIKENEKAQPEVKEEDKKANKPSKKAGSNAKTGIAGVAGVAGILAAASVAYAASKRD